MIRKLMAAAFAMALLLGAGACSSDDDDDSSGGGGDLASTLQQAASDEGEEISEEEATCLADVMVAVLGEDEAQSAAEGGSAGIEEAMGSFTEAMAGTGDPAEAQEVLNNLLEVDDSCLDQLGVNRAELESLSEAAG